MTKSVNLPQKCVMGLNYFGTGHGNGQWDGATTHLNNALQSEHMKNIGTTKV
jgi:hypothetical protein